MRFKTRSNSGRIFSPLKEKKSLELKFLLLHQIILYSYMLCNINDFDLA